MGASLVIRTHPHASREVIKAWVREISANHDIEDGGSCSDEWNMCNGIVFNDIRIFDTVDEAETFISSNAIRREPLLAVKAKVQKALSKGGWSDEKLVELRAQLLAVQNELTTQGSRVLARAKEARSELKACKHCSSRVSLAHVRSTLCPVCGGNLLMTPTDDKQKILLHAKQAAWQVKIDKLVAQLTLKENGGKSIDELVWVVGGLFAS